MAKKKLSKKLLIGVISLILLVCLLAGEAVAWFLMSNKVDSGNIDVGIIGGLDDFGSMSVTVNGKPSDKNNQTTLLPGKTVQLGIKIENTTASNVKYGILLKSASVTYPTSKPAYKYPENIFLSENYFTIVNSKEVLYNIDSITDKEGFFRNFIEPMTNALFYQAYATVKPLGAELITDKKKTTPADLASDKEIVVAENIFLKFNAETFSNGAIDENGNVTVYAGKVIELKLDLTFNGEYYPKYIDGATTYTLKNSNIFIKQELYCVFTFNAAVV